MISNDRKVDSRRGVHSSGSIVILRSNHCFTSKPVAVAFFNPRIPRPHPLLATYITEAKISEPLQEHDGAIFG